MNLKNTEIRVTAFLFITVYCQKMTVTVITRAILRASVAKHLLNNSRIFFF